MSESTWRACNNCGKPIMFGSLYYVCSVSTCNRKRRPLRFCTVDCWDAHLPDANHRSAWAVEETAPTEAEAAVESRRVGSDPGRGSGGRGSVGSGDRRSDEGPRIRRLPPAGPRGTRGATSRSDPFARRPVARQAPSSAPGRAPSVPEEPDDGILVVASKLQEYIRLRSGGMSTSAGVLRILSDHVRRLCDHAIVEADHDGRRTVMDRDLPPRRR